MTNCVEEMMNMAGVNITRQCKRPTDAYCYECDLFVNGRCVSPEILYRPDFTPEKQLEMIKLITSNSDFHINKTKVEWEPSALSDSNDEGILKTHQKDFAQALAQLTTELMKAGELDKKKVKEILDG